MKILVIGSGPTGVHFALSALRKNHDVTMIDVGTTTPPTPLPEEDFSGLKNRLEDPIRYFLGERFNHAMLPESDVRTKLFAFPPSKDYVFEVPSYFRYSAHGFTPLISFAAGGLAEAWSGGCYPLNEAELSEFPFSYNDIEPYYSEVASRIGVAGEDDDLARYFPHHDHLLSPPSLDDSTQRLLARYRDRASRTSNQEITMGRSRQTVLVEGRNGRGGCRYCGRCVWGCPNGALYTPSMTLRECMGYSNFTYQGGLFASHFKLGSDSSIASLVTYAVNGGKREEFHAEAYVVACGTISTSNLFLRSIYKSTGEIIRLTGLMDNHKILAPFINLPMIGRDFSAEAYQYHQLAIGMMSAESGHYIHGQITTLKSATVHTIIQGLPIDLKFAVNAFNKLRSGLGVLSLFLCDWRREENYLTLEHTSLDRSQEEWPELSIHYTAADNERPLIKEALANMRRFFMGLRAPLLPGMTRVHPAGNGRHYSGTLPMSSQKKPWCLSENCQSYDISNLFVIDGAAMPFLPAKQLTFTLMANAVRVAEKVF